MFKIKHNVDIGDLSEITPELFIVLGHLFLFCKREGLESICKVTSLKDDVEAREFNTHSDGRAADISVKGWSRMQIQQCIVYLNLMAKEYGAYSESDKKQRLVVDKLHGTGPHLHIQVKP